jgi:hypothetical protein
MIVFLRVSSRLLFDELLDEAEMCASCGIIASLAYQTYYVILLKNPPFLLREPQDERRSG